MSNIIQIINEEISIIKRDKKKEIFNYDSINEESWYEPKINGQKFQRISFDFENDDSVEKKTLFVKKNLRKDQPIKYEIQIELRFAGGDWEMPVIYFRVEFTHQYSIINNKYSKNPEYVWDVENSSGRRFIIIPPMDAGNKLIEGDGNSEHYDWFAYQNNGLSKEDEKLARITDVDKKNCWKWIEELFEKLIDERHEMLDNN